MEAGSHFGIFTFVADISWNKCLISFICVCCRYDFFFLCLIQYTFQKARSNGIPAIYLSYPSNEYISLQKDIGKVSRPSWAVLCAYGRNVAGGDAQVAVVHVGTGSVLVLLYLIIAPSRLGTTFRRYI
jgi:hypothetical protein